MHIAGEVLRKDLGNGRLNLFVSVGADGSVAHRSVEQTVLTHLCSQQGFADGVHKEGAVWHTLFGLACFDVIFDPNIPSAWVSELQVCGITDEISPACRLQPSPLDLNRAEFYDQRRQAFEQLFQRFETSKPLLISTVLKNFDSLASRGLVGTEEIDPECFPSKEKLEVSSTRYCGLFFHRQLSIRGINLCMLRL